MSEKKKSKPSRWKKLKMWFWSKSRTMDEIIQISSMAEMNVNKILKKLETLRQDKMYICIIPGATMHEVMTAKEAFERAKLRMNWTAPAVLFLNQEIKLMTDEEFNAVVEQNKKLKRSVETQ